MKALQSLRCHEVFKFNKNEMFFVSDAFKMIFCRFFAVKNNLDSGAYPNGPLESGQSCSMLFDSMRTFYLLYFYFD